MRIDRAVGERDLSAHIIVRVASPRSYAMSAQVDQAARWREPVHSLRTACKQRCSSPDDSAADAHVEKPIARCRCVKMASARCITARLELTADQLLNALRTPSAMNTLAADRSRRSDSARSSACSLQVFIAARTPRSRSDATARCSVNVAASRSLRAVDACSAHVTKPRRLPLLVKAATARSSDQR